MWAILPVMLPSLSYIRHLPSGFICLLHWLIVGCGWRCHWRRRRRFLGDDAGSFANRQIPNFVSTENLNPYDYFLNGSELRKPPYVTLFSSLGNHISSRLFKSPTKNFGVRKTRHFYFIYIFSGHVSDYYGRISPSIAAGKLLPSLSRHPFRT